MTSDGQLVSNAPVNKLWGELEAGSEAKGKTPVFHRKVQSIPVPECGRRVKLPCVTAPPTLSTQPSPLNLAVNRPAGDHLPRDKHGRNLVLHCIELQSHIEQLGSLLESGKKDGEGSSAAASVCAVPSHPSQHWWRVENCKLPHLPNEKPELVLPSPAADERQAGVLLRHSLGKQCQFTGYRAAQTLAMDVMVDVVKENMTQFCRTLQLNSQHEHHGRHLGFQNALEQSLRDHDIGGRRELHEFWQSRVVQYAFLLSRRAVEMEQACHRKNLALSDEGGRRKSTLEKTQKRRLPSAGAREESLLLLREDPTGPGEEEELTLDAPLRQQEIKSPDIHSVSFTPLPSEAAETFDFAVDASHPPRKRSRTSSSTDRAT